MIRKDNELSELCENLKDLFSEPRIENSVPKHYVYGLKGLAQLMGCSYPTAFRIKKSGIIDPAISQVGKIIVIDTDLAIDLLKVRRNVGRRNR